MKYSPLFFALLLFSGGILSISGCSKAKQEPALQQENVDPEDRPIAPPPPSYTSREFQKQQDAWYERAMVRPFLAGIPDDKPWKPAAKAYIKKAITAWQTQREFQEAAEDGKGLIGMGCDDPLIAFLVQYFRSRTPDKSGAAEASKDAFARLDQEKRYPRAVARLAGMAANEVLQATGSERSEEIDRRVVELTKESLLAGDYAGDDDYMFLRHTVTSPWGLNHLIRNYGAIANACEAAKAPEWVLHTFKGFMEIKRAFNRPGGTRLPHVDADGSVFSKRYEVARDEFTAAWKLHPTRPDAACEMIGVTMQGYGNEGDTMRLWFDRAVAAQFDYPPAYDMYFLGQIPPLGGSLPGMLRFARICAQTRQFDTEVPEQFFMVLEKIGGHTDWRKIYHRSIITPLVVPTAFGLAEAPSRKEDWKRQYSLAAVQSYLVGDGAAAADALNKAGGELAPEGYDLLHRQDGDFDVMKKEIAILMSAAGKTYWNAEQLYDDGKLDEAIAAFEACEAELKANAPALASTSAGRAQALRVEKAIAAGGWVKIPLEPKIWRFQGGDWKTTAQGGMEIAGSTENATAFTSPCSGQKYELRGEIEVDSPAKDGAEVGILLGEHGTDSYVVCGFKQSPGVDALKASATGHWRERTGRQVEVRPKTPNTFFIHVENGHANFELNGTPVATHFFAYGNPLHHAYSRIGLAARGLHPGTTIRVRNLEIRSNFD